MTEPLENFAAKLSKLERLDLRDLGSSSFRKFIPLLALLPNLKELDLSGSRVRTHKDFEAAAAAIRKMKQLRSLGLFFAAPSEGGSRGVPENFQMFRYPERVLGLLYLHYMPKLRRVSVPWKFEEVKRWRNYFVPNVVVDCYLLIQAIFSVWGGLSNHRVGLSCWLTRARRT
jgi:hypothetical protein